MAQGDLTKESSYDKIEVVNDWIIQVRRVDKVLEEQADGSKLVISSGFVRDSYAPFLSNQDADGKWTHTDTDLSNVNAKVRAIAETAWDNDTKTAYKTHIESQGI
tara:strand:+ start:231 stop:545 length:315 start_codon:yes stop_codon:yes gene_type:complete